jgi:hypothetical protein
MLGVAVGIGLTAHKGRKVASRRDTLLVEVHDTLPVPQVQRIIRYERIPADTVRDTVYIPIEQKEYITDTYHAWVSGYSANLDSITVIQRTVTRTIPKRQRWALGIGAGYGLGGPYVGVGIHYNIIGW